MPSLKELDDDRIYHDGREIDRLRNELHIVSTEREAFRHELENANKTIEHLTKAHKVLVERLDLAHKHNSDLRKIITRQAYEQRKADN